MTNYQLTYLRPFSMTSQELLSVHSMPLNCSKSIFDSVVLISPTFYEQLFANFLLPKKIQSQTVSSEKLFITLMYKTSCLKYIDETDNCFQRIKVKLMIEWQSFELLIINIFFRKLKKRRINTMTFKMPITNGAPSTARASGGTI